MGASESQDRAQVHVFRSKWRQENEGMCAAFQRLFFFDNASDGAFYAREQMHSIHENSAPEDLAYATNEKEREIREAREKLLAERQEKRAAASKSEGEKANEFKLLLRAGVQVRQHMKGKMRDAKLWIDKLTITERKNRKLKKLADTHLW